MTGPNSMTDANLGGAIGVVDGEHDQERGGDCEEDGDGQKVREPQALEGPAEGRARQRRSPRRSAPGQHCDATRRLTKKCSTGPGEPSPFFSQYRCFTCSWPAVKPDSAAHSYAESGLENASWT